MLRTLRRYDDRREFVFEGRWCFFEHTLGALMPLNDECIGTVTSSQRVLSMLGRACNG